MAERVLGAGLRVLLGVIGAGALGSALVLGAHEVRLLSVGAAPRVARLVIIVLGVIAIGGVTLLRGAICGRIAVRDNRR